MSIIDHAHSLLDKARKFQKSILSTFSKRADTLLQLVEALASSQNTTSVVELSQTAPFQRTHSNVHKAIAALSAAAEVKNQADSLTLTKEPVESHASITNPTSIEAKIHSNEQNGQASSSALNPQMSDLDCEDVKIDPALFLQQTRQWTDIFAHSLPKETERPFKLFALDATSNSRPYSQTLEERTYVHQAGQLGAPVTIGLQASLMAAIPEAVVGEAKWTLPLSIERIPSTESPSETAAKQLKELQRLYPEDLCVIGCDSGYNGLHPEAENQILIIRGRINRTGQRPHKPQEAVPSGRGRPRKYDGPVIHFANDLSVGDEGGPDEELEHETICNGQKVIVLLNTWKDVYVHGQRELVNVVKCEVFLKSDPSRTLFANPLLLIVVGKRRHELSSLQVYECYLRRFDIEHVFRFLKQKLLFTAYQTPVLQRQINWWWICLMAYWLLYLTRDAAPESNRPWMPKRRANMTATPGEVKRVF